MPVYVCDSLAQLHIKMGQLDAALNNISEAIEILSNSEKSDTLAEALIIQGIIFSKLAQWGEARISFVKSLQIAQQTEVWELGGIAMLTLLEEMCERLGTSERNEALSRAEFYLGNTQNSLLRQRLSACVAMVKEADALEQQKLDWQVQQEKMTALGQLAFGVAHDFNNSLAIIKGRASLMTQEKLSEPVAHGLRVIARTVEDAAKMVRRIQDFGRLKPEPMFVPVALSPLLQDIRDLFQLACQEQEVSLEIKANSPAVVLGDTTELREVLVNLMTNSLEATASQGLICLSLECVENKVEVAVKDTGRGMLPEVERRIFEPFFTTKKERGTGMGLAVSYGIVQRHGGEFVVKSKAGEGTTVQVILPLAKEIEDMA